MPLFEFECHLCGKVQEHVERFEDRKTARWPCLTKACKGSARYMGLSPTVVGNGHKFGVILNNGQKVVGNLGKSAPNKRLQRK